MFLFFFNIFCGVRAALDELVNAEIQQVEQTSDETNSVKGITETEIQQVEPNSEANSVKGKEVTTTKRRAKTPLNFIAILNDANISINTTSPDELRDQLYAGVFLEPKKIVSSISISSISYINRWNIII